MRRSLLGSSLLSSSYVRKSLAFVYEKTIKAQKISSKELKQFLDVPDDPVGICDIESARRRISPHLCETPVLTCSTFDDASGRQLFFKCENLQKTGSFKVRGATNAILRAKEEHERMGKVLPGVVTHSSGNHGQAVAWASVALARTSCVVVVPQGTCEAKCRAIRSYGAKVVFCEPSPQAKEEAVDSIAATTGSIVIPTCDDNHVIAGQGTIGCEFLQQVPDLDAILLTCSGGSMAAGVCLAVKAIKPECRVILVEPKGKDLGPCLRSGERLWPNPPRLLRTVAEGIRTQQMGSITFPIVCRHAEKEVITVDDSEMLSCSRLAAERMKLVVEPAAGAALAAALKLGGEEARLGSQDCQLRRVGVVLCGGNVDVGTMPWTL